MDRVILGNDVQKKLDRFEFDLGQTKFSSLVGSVANDSSGGTREVVMDLGVNKVLQSCQTRGEYAKGGNGLGFDKLHNCFGEMPSKREC